MPEGSELGISGDAPESSGIAWDIESVLPAFEQIDGEGWYAVSGDGEHPYLRLEGL